MVEAPSYPRENIGEMGTAHMTCTGIQLVPVMKKKSDRKKSCPNLFWNVQKWGFSSIFSPPQGGNFEDLGDFLDYSPPLLAPIDNKGGE